MNKLFKNKTVEKMFDVIEDNKTSVPDQVYKDLIETFGDILKVTESAKKIIELLCTRCEYLEEVAHGALRESGCEEEVIKHITEPKASNDGVGAE